MNRSAICYWGGGLRWISGSFFLKEGKFLKQNVNPQKRMIHQKCATKTMRNIFCPIQILLLLALVITFVIVLFRHNGLSTRRVLTAWVQSLLLGSGNSVSSGRQWCC